MEILRKNKERNFKEKSKKENYNKRNYINSFSHYHYCFINFSSSKHSNFNRREWNLSTGW